MKTYFGAIVMVVRQECLHLKGPWEDVRSLYLLHTIITYFAITGYNCHVTEVTRISANLTTMNMSCVPYDAKLVLVCPMDKSHLSH